MRMKRGVGKAETQSRYQRKRKDEGYNSYKSLAALSTFCTPKSIQVGILVMFILITKVPDAIMKASNLYSHLWHTAGIQMCNF